MKNLMILIKILMKIVNILDVESEKEYYITISNPFDTTVDIF